MKDIQTQLEKLRREAAECLVLSNLATDPEKRELFTRVAEHITGLASAVQNEVAIEPANVIGAATTPVVDHPNTPVIDQKQANRSRQMLPWFVVVILIAAAGALVWPRAEKTAPSVAALEAKAEPPPAPQEDAKQTIANFLSAEDEKRKVLSEQLGALAARVDNLEKAHAEIAEPTTKRDAETVRQPRHRKHRSAVFNNAPRFQF
jgi:Asp-tRNA(Asn)/Glu-tRNA(Gln) amidotransferase C subunit